MPCQKALIRLYLAIRRTFPPPKSPELCHLVDIDFAVRYSFFPKLFQKPSGRSGGAMVLGKLPVLRRPTNLDKSGARAYCACSRCGGCLDIFFSHLSLLFSLSLSLGDGPI